MNNQKMITTAKNLDIFAKVGGKIISAFGIVCFVFAVLVLILGTKMFAEGSVTLDLDFLKLHLTDTLPVQVQYLKLFAVLGLLTGGTICLLTWRGLTLLRRILAPIKEGRPFEDGVSLHLKKIALLVLIGGAITELLGIIERIIITKAYPLEQIFATASIDKIESSFTMDFNFVLIACVILFLSYIFSYGQNLQTESDETL